MLDTHTRRGLGGLHDTHDAYDITIQPFQKSALASPLLILKRMLNTYTRRGLGGLHDTHDTYDTYDIVIWKIVGSFALIDTENIHIILIRVVGWRDSLYATHAALACFTFPILSTLP